MSNEVIKNRYDFILVFDVKNGNPNGDPDASNMPRTDERGYGLVTDVCLKRKIRNYVMNTKMDDNGEPKEHYDIFIKRGLPLNNVEGAMLVNAGAEEKNVNKKKPEKLDSKNREKIEKPFTKSICEKFFDVRTFGGVMTKSTSLGLNGQIKGPVQLGFASSLDVIVPQEVSIDRIAVTTEEDFNKKREGTFGSKWIIPYGMYRVEGHISANEAIKTTGFSKEDLELLWEAIENMFEDDHSSLRGDMAVRELIIFEHESRLGNCPAHKLSEAVDIKKKENVETPYSHNDYIITIKEDDIPASVTMYKRVHELEEA